VLLLQPTNKKTVWPEHTAQLAYLLLDRTPYFTLLNCKGSWNDRFTSLPFPLPTHSLLAFSGLAARTREAAGVAAASQAAPPWPPARSPSGGSPPPTHLTRGAGSCLTGDSNRRLEARDLGLLEVQCDHTKRQLVEDGGSTISQRDFSRGSNDLSWVPDG